MIKRIKEDKFLFILILVGVILVAVVTSIILGNNKTVTAVVPTTTIESATVITEDMVTEVAVSADTPSGFIRSASTVIGSRAKTTLAPNQLLYESDFMTSWGDFTDSELVPDDYIVTSVQVPDERAVGGIITGGDYIDIMYTKASEEMVQATLDGTATQVVTDWVNNNAEYIIANALVLTTNSALAENQGSDLSTVAEDSNSGSFYVIALSYNDYKKLMKVQSNGDNELWLNISPAQNLNNGPLIAQMTQDAIGYLHDAQKQVLDENGNLTIEEYTSDATTTPTYNTYTINTEDANSGDENTENEVNNEDTNSSKDKSNN